MNTNPVAGSLTLCLSIEADKDLRVMQNEALTAMLPAEVLMVGYRVARVYATDFGRQAIFNWSRLALTITGQMTREFVYKEVKRCFEGRELDLDQFIISVNFFCWLTSEVAIYNRKNPGLLLDPRLEEERDFRWNLGKLKFRDLDRKENKLIIQLLQMFSERVDEELHLLQHELYMNGERLVKFDRKSNCLISEGLPRTVSAIATCFYCLYLNIFEE